MIRILRGGRGRGTGGSVGPGTLSTTFQIVNTETASSLGFKQVGLPIKSGEMPDGNRPVITRSGGTPAAQFDNFSSWWDNTGKKYCTAWIRDTDFTSSESRTYTLSSEAGAPDNSSSLTLAAALSGTDFKVEFTNVENCVDTVSPGDHVASLNTFATVLTRVTKYESGPVADSWEIWGRAIKTVGSAIHPHLKVRFYLTVLKNANGSINHRRIAAEVSMNEWAVADKRKLLYVATLKNGATTIETYTGAIGKTKVEHNYMTSWMTVRLNDDVRHGERHCIGASIPTLHYLWNREYIISTGLIPPYDITKSFVMPTNYKTATNNNNVSPYYYQPGTSGAHRAHADAVGAYMGRGLLPNIDAITFVTRLADDFRASRIAAYAGLHIPFQSYSNKTRTRPGDAGPDEANTIMPLILQDDTGTMTNDWTAYGMPVSSHAYKKPFQTAAIDADGYIRPVGNGTSSGGGAITGTTLTMGTNPTNPFVVGNLVSGDLVAEGTRITAVNSSTNYTVNISQTIGNSTILTCGGGYGSFSHVGRTVWSNTSADQSHTPNHVYFMALIDGERHWFNALLSNGNHAVQHDYGGGHPLGYWYKHNTPHRALFPGVPSTVWRGTAYYTQASQERSAFFALNNVSSMAICPDDRVEAPYVKAIVQHAGNWLKKTSDYVTNDFNGLWIVAGRLGTGPSPWQNSIGVQAMYWAYAKTRDSNFLPMAHLMARDALAWAKYNRIAGSRSQVPKSRHKMQTEYNITTNPFYQRPYTMVWETGTNGTITAATNTIYMDVRASASWGSIRGDIPFANLDRVVSTDMGSSWVNQNITELTLGTEYYMRNVNVAARTFQLSETPTGAIIDFTNDYTAVSLGMHLAAMVDFPPNESADTYGVMAFAAMCMAYRYGQPEMTQAYMDLYVDHYSAASVNHVNWASWRFSPTT
jgi:hypothetical protein